MIYSKEDTIKIQNKVSESKILLWKRNLDNIMGVEVEYYLYNTLEERQKHVESQKILIGFMMIYKKKKKHFMLTF